MNRVTCPYCSRSGISVSLHADSATCPECDLIFGVEVEVYAVALPESERTEPEKPPAPVPAWPPDDDPTWMQIDGRLWVTDGVAMLRADCPALPTAWDDQHKGWRNLPSGERAGAAKVLSKPPTVFKNARFHPRFAAILAATKPVPDSIARTFGGQVVALIMPLSLVAACPSVDSRGQP